jgi:hypothetical protein
MQLLKQAIDTKLLDSAIFNDCGGRCYYNIAGTTDYPRLVYSRISGTPDNVFAKTGESVLLQFDLFSMQSAGDTEILTMETDLKSLLDDCTLTITGKVCVGFTRQNIVGPLTEDVSALGDGTSLVNHTAIDYQVDYQSA